MTKDIVSQGENFSTLARTAWTSLSGRRLPAAGVVLLVVFCQCGAQHLTGGLSSFLLAPLMSGLALYCLLLVRQQNPSINIIFSPYNQFLRYLWAQVRTTIFILLWALLLIIPGIIATYRYAMTFYIMLDDPNCSVKEAMTESSRIMYGHKLRLFGYSFLLSIMTLLVTVLTLGIGLFWFLPWLCAFWAAFYDSIRRKTEIDANFAEAEIV